LRRLEQKPTTETQGHGEKFLNLEDGPDKERGFTAEARRKSLKHRGKEESEDGEERDWEIKRRRGRL
jgi:hypothetical protein